MNEPARNLMTVDVTCDPPRPDTYEAETARMVVEVLAPSNRGIGWQRKLEEYTARDGLAYILRVESETCGALLLSRSENATWDETTVEEIAGTIDLAAIGCQFALADVCDGIDFEAA